MKFFANKINGNYLRDILPNSDIEIDWVRAAIAYGSDASTLLENCLQNKRRLDIWMRYDHTVPVTPSLLRKFLQSVSQNIFCYLIPDVLHSKVIWWKNYGVYIGSANLTDRAWVSNIEFGVFIPDGDLEADDGISEIETFFDALMACDAAMQLTQGIIDDQERIQQHRSLKLKQLNDEAEKLRSINKWEGPAFVSKQKAHDARKSNFIKEWNNGLNILKSIADRAPAFRPKWLHEDVPHSWQADQFLHAFYYNEVVDGARHPYDEYYQRNKSDPAGSRDTALKWWSNLSAPPSDEDINCHERAPIIRTLLGADRIQSISLQEFEKICQANHSTVDHVRRMRLQDLGISHEQISTEERVAAFAALIWNQRNGSGERINELLHFVFDGGSPDDIPSRLFDAVNQPHRKFPHFGTNQIAELVGWARPEVCPPRNGRTSKGLKALGYDVRVY